MGETNEKNLDPEKRQLEIEKLGLEIKDLKKSFWKKPQWFASALTAIISILSAIILFINGVFDKKYQQYKAEKEVLELATKI